MIQEKGYIDRKTIFLVLKKSLLEKWKKMKKAKAQWTLLNVKIYMGPLERTLYWIYLTFSPKVPKNGLRKKSGKKVCFKN